MKLFIYQILKVVFLCFLCASLTAQSAAVQLDKGLSAYQASDFETANQIYQEVAENDTLPIRLEAISGLINVATYQNKPSVADSLIQRGEAIANLIADVQSEGKFRLASGEYYRNFSQFDKALTAFRSAVALFKTEPEKEVFFADALQYIGLTHEQTSAHDSALQYILLAKGIYDSKGDTSTLKFALFSNSLGSIHLRLGHIDDAKKQYKKATAILRKERGETFPDIAMVLGNLASAYRSENNNAKAMECTQKALQINRINKDKLGQSFNFYSLGVLAYVEGDYGRTRDYMLACVRIREKLLGADHYRLIGPYNVLGIAMDEAGDQEASRSYYQKARKLIAVNFQDATLEEGHILENLALSFKAIGQIDSAMVYLLRADKIYNEILPPKTLEMADHYHTYGSILRRSKDAKNAEKYVKQSLDILDQLQLEDSTDYVHRYDLLGKIYADRSDWEKADRYFAKAIDILTTKDSRGKELYVTTPDALRLIQGQVDYYFLKYQELKADEYLKQFHKYSDIYIQVAENLRRQFIDPYTKSTLIKQTVPVYKAQIGNYAKLYDQSQKASYIEDIFSFAEYSRATMLRDMQDSKISVYAGVDTTILSQERTLKQELTDLNTAFFEHPDSTKISQDLFEAKEALNKFVEQTRKSHPRYYELQYSQGIVDMQKIQSKLQPREVLVEYLYDDSSYYAITITKDAVDFTHLANKTKVDQLVQQYRKDIRSRNNNATNATGSQLYHLLWAPLNISIDSRVVVVPIGTLYYLNFETLPTPTDSYLIHNQTISYALSANIYSNEKRNSVGDGLAIAIAPGFENDIKDQYRTALDSLESLDSSYLYTVRQPWSVKLATKLKSEYKNKAYIGREAVESNIKSRLSKGSILYFGTHAISDELDPLRSRLVLTKEIGDQKEDGYLHAYEIYGLALDSDLTILSACESGVGRLREGEGMISLAHSIHYAGCASTVISLWQVDEQTNTTITDRFLENLAAGQVKSEALRNAKLTYLQNLSGEGSHPFYWGGMILMGNDGEVTLTKKQPWHRTLFVVSLLLVACGLGFYWLRKKS